MTEASLRSALVGRLVTVEEQVNSTVIVYNLRIPYCGQQLRWQVIQDLLQPDLAPDVVFDSKDFIPLACGHESSGSSPSDQLRRDIQQLLRSWRSAGPAVEARCIAALASKLLQLFFEHQRRRISELGDERLAFELGMLEETGCSELLLTDHKDASSRRACFGIPINGLNLSCADLILQYQQQQEQRQQQESRPLTPTSPQQLGGPAAPEPCATTSCSGSGDGSGGAGAAGGFALHVAFRVGPGNAHSTPTLQLQAPAWFRASLPPLPLPAWNPQAPLSEYVPLVRERLQQHLAQHCAAAAAKYQVFEQLVTLFGPALEVRMAAAASPPAGPNNASPSYSSIAGTASNGSTGGGGGGAGSALVGSGGAGISVAAFHLLQDQQPLLLFIEVLPRFPEEQPAITLQSVRRTGPEGAITWRAYPWSPRWPVEEMAARIYSFVKQQAATATAKLTGAAV